MGYMNYTNSAKILSFIIVILCIILYYVANYKINNIIDAFTNENQNAEDIPLYFMTNQITNGRFGNNVIEYIGAKLIQKTYNFAEVISIEHKPKNAYIINDTMFRDIMNSYQENRTLPTLDLNRPIVLEAYCQRSDILTIHRDYIKSIFTSENCDAINLKYKVCDIVNHSFTLPSNYSPSDDLVMHLRLDDFRTHQNGGIFNAEDIKNKILRPITFKQLYIICEKLKEPWEKDYVSQFNEFNPIIVNGELLDDYSFIKSANRLILSPSSFAWSAAFLGSAKEIHIPLQPFQGVHTDYYMGCFSDNCKMYSDIRITIDKV